MGAILTGDDVKRCRNWSDAHGVTDPISLERTRDGPVFLTASGVGYTPASLARWLSTSVSAGRGHDVPPGTMSLRNTDPQSRTPFTLAERALIFQSAGVADPRTHSRPLMDTAPSDRTTEESDSGTSDAVSESSDDEQVSDADVHPEISRAMRDGRNSVVHFLQYHDVTASQYREVQWMLDNWNDLLIETVPAAPASVRRSVFVAAIRRNMEHIAHVTCGGLGEEDRTAVLRLLTGAELTRAVDAGMDPTAVFQRAVADMAVVPARAAMEHGAKLAERGAVGVRLANLSSATAQSLAFAIEVAAPPYTSEVVMHAVRVADLTLLDQLFERYPTCIPTDVDLASVVPHVATGREAGFVGAARLCANRGAMLSNTFRAALQRKKVTIAQRLYAECGSAAHERAARDAARYGSAEIVEFLKTKGVLFTEHDVLLCIRSSNLEALDALIGALPPSARRDPRFLATAITVGQQAAIAKLVGTWGLRFMDVTPHVLASACEPMMASNAPRKRPRALT